ncbi:protein CFAP107 [Perognathus longimembris pacificus]|uniref:protein CFAP107 n=1 Tax=Perognathus longimembris pacificus TaxID=214514 RepID=UPI002018B6B9|nr:protein CFAP107 [Perognathus longimembris pacificus]
MFLIPVISEPYSTQNQKSFSSKVLIGNWVEDRRRFSKATDQTPQSVSRKEYIPFLDHEPDQISRLYTKKRMEGLPYKHLMTHHREPSHRYLISAYDDHYNRRNYNPAMPAVRTWSRQKLLWLPEKSDFPLLGPPTNYGLYEQQKERWLSPQGGLRESLYTSSYSRPPLGTQAPLLPLRSLPRF